MLLGNIGCNGSNSDVYILFVHETMNKKSDHQGVFDKAAMERLWRGVSKTNVKDIEDLKSAKQLRKVLTQKEIKTWLSDTGRSLKKKLLKS